MRGTLILSEFNRFDEVLIITMEECGELIQACSKVMRTKNQQKKYINNLKDEVGDVVAMIEIMKQYHLITQEEIDQRVAVKREKLQQWSNIFE